MAKTRVGSWSTSALLALGVFVTSAMAEEAPAPSADAPRSDQRRLRLLLSAGPVLWIEAVHPDIEVIRRAARAAVRQPAEAERRRRAVRRGDPDVGHLHLDRQIWVPVQRAVGVGERPRAGPADVGELCWRRLWRHVVCLCPCLVPAGPAHDATRTVRPGALRIVEDSMGPQGEIARPAVGL